MHDPWQRTLTVFLNEYALFLYLRGVNFVIFEQGQLMLTLRANLYVILAKMNWLGVQKCLYVHVMCCNLLP